MNISKKAQRAMKSGIVDGDHPLRKSLGVKPRRGMVIKCVVCKKVFYRRLARISNVCSSKCFSIRNMRGNRRRCKMCKKLYHAQPSQIKWRGTSFCSLECRIHFRKETCPRIMSPRAADQVFSKIVRERDGWHCQRCGRNLKENTRTLHCSHFWPRGHYGTRYDLENCIALCYHCHYYEWEKEKQGAYMDYMIKKLGQERYEALKLRSQRPIKKKDAILEFMGTLNKKPLTEEFVDNANPHYDLRLQNKLDNLKKKS